MINNLLKLLLIMVIILMPLQVYGENPKVVKVWLGLYRYNGTYYDPLGNTFDGESSYLGPDYKYTIINYQLNNGVIIRQMIKLNDPHGTSNPAATAVLFWTAPNGTTYSIFEWNDPNTLYACLYNVTPLPYVKDIPVGSQIKIVMNNNYNDDNYIDGEWIINISENGIVFNNAKEYSIGHYHNSSFIFQNLNRNISWEIRLPYKNPYGRIYYSGIIPFNGSNATIYDISGNTPYAGKILQFAPPTELFKSSGGSALKSKEETVEMDYQAEEAKKTIEDTKSTISQIKSKYNIKEAESLLSQAEKAFNKGDYSKAKKTALEAKSLALDIDQDGILNEEDFAPYINNHYIYTIAIVIILILAVNYYTSRKRKKEYERKMKEFKSKVEKWKKEGYDVSELEEMLK